MSIFSEGGRETGESRGVDTIAAPMQHAAQELHLSFVTW